MTKRLLAALITYLLLGAFTISYALIIVLSAVYVIGCRVLGIAPAQFPPRDPR